MLTQQHLAHADYHTEYSTVAADGFAAGERRKDQEMSDVAAI
jgi:hypothetical protein